MEPTHATTQRIVELESNLEKAALLGKQLLEQLSLKNDETDELREKSIRMELELDSLKQQLFNAERTAESAGIRERNTFEELNLYKEMNPDMTETNRFLQEKINHLKLETDRKTQTISDLESELATLESALCLAKHRMETLENETINRERVTEASIKTETTKNEGDEVDDEFEKVSTELIIIQGECKRLSELHECAVKENHSLKRSLKELTQEKQELERNVDFAKNLVNQKREQIDELKEQIEQLEAEKFDPGRRGNSIFAEVEDRRLQVESKLIELKVRLQSAESSKRRLKAQLSQCYSSLQTMASHTTKSQQNYVQTLETEIVRLREELSTCSTRIPMSSDSNDDNQAVGGVFSDEELQHNPLAGLLVTERKRLASLNKKMSQLIDQESHRSQQIVRLGMDLRNAQEVAERLTNQQAILMMKLQEIEDHSPSPNGEDERKETINQKELLQEIVNHNETEIRQTGALMTGKGPKEDESNGARIEEKENSEKAAEDLMKKKTVNFIQSASEGLVAQAAEKKRQPQGRKVAILKSSNSSSNQRQNNDCKTQ